MLPTSVLAKPEFKCRMHKDGSWPALQLHEKIDFCSSLNYFKNNDNSSACWFGLNNPLPNLHVSFLAWLRGESAQDGMFAVGTIKSKMLLQYSSEKREFKQTEMSSSHITTLLDNMLY